MNAKMLLPASLVCLVAWLGGDALGVRYGGTLTRAETDAYCSLPGTAQAERDGRPLGDLDRDCDVDLDDYALLQADFTGPYTGPPGCCYENADCDPADYCSSGIGECAQAGQCTLRPTGCPAVWDPVCGCDGTTYANQCAAAAAGMNVDFLGECTAPPCTSNGVCNPEDYCAKAVGDCAGTGQCTPRPAACPAVWDPVCGCDGVTYANHCYAAMSGENVRYHGECLTGAPCVSNAECEAVDPADYCAKDEGDCDGTGQCTPRPEMCPAVWDPVCGCDGVTYANDCYAAGAGENVDYPGDCTTSGCRVNAQCAAGDYCAKAEGDCLGQGECDLRPTVCPHVWTPVCGCDGVTYSNDCYAHAAGQNVLYQGECPPSACLTNGECSSDEYCAKATGACEAPGLCAERPEFCLAVWDPVCGCDGVTYSNYCYAARAGQSVDYPGECTSQVTCWSNDDCDAEDFCAIAVGICVGPGVCAERPEFCLALWDPVCGCDNVTYSNYCYAAREGQSVQYEGECQDVPCTDNSQCGSPDYCRKDDGDCLGTGWCAPRPNACAALYDPVCGCDDQTYSNACYAAGNGENVMYDGECLP